MYIVSEIAENGDLKKFLIQNPEISFEKRFEFVKNIFEVMISVKNLSWIHNDIKEHNIFIDVDEKILIGDLSYFMQV